MTVCRCLKENTPILEELVMLRQKVSFYVANYLHRHLASRQGNFVAQRPSVMLCVCVRCISLGGEVMHCIQVLSGLDYVINVEFNL